MGYGAWAYCYMRQKNKQVEAGFYLPSAMVSGAVQDTTVRWAHGFAATLNPPICLRSR